MFMIILGKAKRLKQAKEEAQAEIEKYKKERDVEYKQHERQVLIYCYCIHPRHPVDTLV